MLDGKKNKTAGVCLKKRFGRKTSFVFASLVLRWWVKWGGVSCGFPCSAVLVGAEFIPIVTIVADEAGDFTESLVRYDVWEGHGSGMGCFGSVLLLKEDFLWGVGVGWEGGREAGGRCVLRFFVDCVGGQKRFFVLCAFLWARKGHDLLWGVGGGTCIPCH